MEADELHAIEAAYGIAPFLMPLLPLVALMIESQLRGLWPLKLAGLLALVLVLPSLGAVRYVGGDPLGPPPVGPADMEAILRLGYAVAITASALILTRGRWWVFIVAFGFALFIGIPGLPLPTGACYGRHRDERVQYLPDFLSRKVEPQQGRSTRRGRAKRSSPASGRW